MIAVHRGVRAVHPPTFSAHRATTLEISTVSTRQLISFFPTPRQRVDRGLDPIEQTHARSASPRRALRSIGCYTEIQPRTAWSRCAGGLFRVTRNAAGTWSCFSTCGSLGFLASGKGSERQGLDNLRWTDVADGPPPPTDTRLWRSRGHHHKHNIKGRRTRERVWPIGLHGV